MGDFRTYLRGAVVLLLANELLLGLVVNFKNGSSASGAGPGDALPPPGGAPPRGEPPRGEGAADAPAPSFDPHDNDHSNFQGRSRAGHGEPPDANASAAFGHDVLRRACLTHDGAAHRISYEAVRGSWDGRTEDRTDPESLHLATRKNPWLRTSHVAAAGGRGREEGAPPAPASNVNVTGPLMFVPPAFDASRCVHDVLFSLLPAAHAGGLRGFAAVAVERPAWDKADKGPVREWAGDYCTAAIRRLGWFREVVEVPNGTCAEDLWVPPFLYHRYPRGWARRQGNGGSKQAVGSRANEYLHSGDLPMGAMVFFQQQMWKSFIAQNKFLRRSRKTRIVFDSREASGRGEWTNADAVAAEVRAKLDPDAYEVAVEDDVAAMTVEEQAALYHGAAAVVAPQGSSLANVAFLRPGAMVFEITCGDASWIRDWVMDMRVLHSTVRAEGPPCAFEHRTYHVRPAGLVDLILDAFWAGIRKEKKEVKEEGAEEGVRRLRSAKRIREEGGGGGNS